MAEGQKFRTDLRGRADRRFVMANLLIVRLLDRGLSAGCVAVLIRDVFGVNGLFGAGSMDQSIRYE